MAIYFQNTLAKIRTALENKNNLGSIDIFKYPVFYHLSAFAKFTMTNAQYTKSYDIT